MGFATIFPIPLFIFAATLDDQGVYGIRLWVGWLVGVIVGIFLAESRYGKADCCPREGLCVRCLAEVMSRIVVGAVVAALLQGGGFDALQMELVAIGRNLAPEIFPSPCE